MNSGRMDKVTAVARLVAKKSAHAFNSSRESHKANCDQLEQLIQFKADYESALGTKGSAGISAKQLQDYRLFLGQLTEAIDQQEKHVQASGANLELEHARWLSDSQRRMALEQLVDIRRREEARIREKAEQRQSDADAISRNLTNDPS